VHTVSLFEIFERKCNFEQGGAGSTLRLDQREMGM
jgi:hypothetical protein